MPNVWHDYIVVESGAAANRGSMPGKFFWLPNGGHRNRHRCRKYAMRLVRHSPEWSSDVLDDDSTTRVFGQRNR